MSQILRKPNKNKIQRELGPGDPNKKLKTNQKVYLISSIKIGDFELPKDFYEVDDCLDMDVKDKVHITSVDPVSVTRDWMGVIVCEDYHKAWVYRDQILSEEEYRNHLIDNVLK